MFPFRPIALGALLLQTLASGCLAQEPDPSADDSWTLRDDDENRGVWISNGIVEPDVTGIDPDFGLDSPQGLPDTGVLLASEAGRKSVQYMVECALPENVSITKQIAGESFTFQGRLGLAPEWEDDACDEDCQEWVSACMMARTNASGQEVIFWMQAEHEAIGTNYSLEYSAYEASFFGNLFAPTPSAHFCRGTVVGPLLAELHGRTCSNVAGASCDFVEYDQCELESRCQWDTVALGLLGPLGAPTAANCQSGTLPSNSSFHTISTYVAPL